MLQTFERSPVSHREDHVVDFQEKAVTQAGRQIEDTRRQNSGIASHSHRCIEHVRQGSEHGRTKRFKAWRQVIPD